ncbi:ATP-dependent helicase [Peribacillus cavernae]|uniref:DNA 3'-5' helicase n=1 Tax=Peribacillus cavernae TaxID=1674310 RepID=A0A3S0U3G6_9BACI|nr:ATP-dependent helicase [Peribacillus cavernae]MDQ0217461.1 DNA helicase-2/ATP-dependent DNA helicase PcrA [Peribacillus cavernae]RUQ30095.1 ATP-dependent helicase [Peribacillus cavernae]
MKAARSGNDIVHLEAVSVDRLQTIYEKGRRSELTCPICGSLLKLHIGIHEPPYFDHSFPSPDCERAILESAPQKITGVSVDSQEHSGFRLPKGKVIRESVQQEGPFMQSMPIKGNPAFLEKLLIERSIEDTYLTLLEEHGVTLDEQQMAAATAIEGPLLVLSGAGSGKTRVLTVRTAYMITVRKVDPKTIMLVTFTAKAAKEMKERLLSYPGISASAVNQLVSGTFHSVFYKILIFHEPEKWQRNLLIKWNWEKEKIVKNAGRDYGLDEKEFAYDSALQQIGLWKNSLLFPEDIKPIDDWEIACAYLYKKYEEYKQKTMMYDFDDMLVGCYSLLKSRSDLLEKYKRRFQYFLVDEFQDINKVQYELIKMLSSGSNNLCVVGDDDQAIYSFRGSDPSFILHFEKDYPAVKIVKLTENYRSAHEIVATANRIIKGNQSRMDKAMRAQHNFSEPAVLFFPYDEELEATMIVTDIQEKVALGARPSDFAILYRTHSMSRAIFERLAASSLPFVIDQDAESFYERRIVRGMLAFLRLSMQPQDPRAAAAILSPLFLKQNVLQEMKAQTILRDCDFIDTFSFVKTGLAFQERKLKALPAKIRSLRNVKPIIALEIVEKDLGYQDFVKKRGTEGNIEKGSDDIRDLKVAAKQFETIGEFLDHADHMIGMNKEVKQLSKHFTDAIQLTTIHRSKGLEYKTVYVLSAVEGSIPHDFALDSYRKGDVVPLEEERRLMYVAATRASLGLYFSIPQTRRGKKAFPSRFLKFY